MPSKAPVAKCAVCKRTGVNHHGAICSKCLRKKYAGKTKTVRLANGTIVHVDMKGGK